jgi:iron complex transport system permease protein
MALAGAALAASGAALQAALQNPLVEPSLVGLSAGAALGAVAAHASGLAAHFLPAIPAAAFAGALLAAGAVYLIAHARGRPSAGALLLTGIAASSLCSSLVSVLLLRSGQHRVHEIFAWLLGSADGARWEDLRLSLAPVAIGTVGLFALQRVIDALALGEEHAVSIGVDLHRARALLLLLVALAAGGAVSVTGPIAFVGLMVPHLVRPFTGPATRRLLPAAILGGGAFLVGCDLVARLLSPAVDVPVGVVTALCGVPFFLALLQRARP